MSNFNLIFLFGSLLCAASDFLTFKIPNKILLALIVLFVLRAVIFMPLPEVYNHIITSAVVLAVGFGVYFFKIMGAGDAKFLAVCGLWISQDNIFSFAFYTLIAGAILALIYIFFEDRITRLRHYLLLKLQSIAWGKWLFKDILNLPNLGLERVGKGMMPYGVAIFSGLIYTYVLNKGSL